MKYKRIVFVLLFGFISFVGFAQNNRVDVIQQRLDSLSRYVKVLNDSIDISVTNVSVQEFLRGIALANNVNLSIASGLTETVVNNFNNVKFKDVLVFLVKEYDLDIEIIGNIISVKKYVPQAVVKSFEPKNLQITKNGDNLYTIDLQKDTLQNVAKILTQLSGQNIIIRNEIRDTRVSGYIQNQSIRTIVENIASMNDLEFNVESGNTFVLSSANSSSKKTSKSSKNTGNYSDESEPQFQYTVVDLPKKIISIDAYQVPLDTIIRVVSEALKVDYNILTTFNTNITIVANNISYEDLLNVLYKGSKFSYRNLRGVYLLGEEQTSGMQVTKLIPLEFRTTDKLKDVFPKQISEGLEIKEFVELNSFLVSGSPEKVTNFEQFIVSIDKTVPVVLIEVMIIDVLKTHTVTTGINAGKGAPAVESKNTILPGVDVTLSSNTINRLLNSFNGFGWFSLGNVSTDFYLQLQALESEGVIKVRSTPKLATLNGHEATLTSGETRYYVEEQSNIISSNAISQTNTKQYKSVNADLTITIKPIVSGNNQITLEIEVSQSDFKDSELKGAPPNSINRKFKSLIRVKDGEMVLLGGLERNEDIDKGSGLPLLSRIPVIKWFFSSRTKSKSKSKLDIFIKPTIIF